MSAATPAYLEFVDFIAAGTSPESVLEFRPSAETCTRFEELVSLSKEKRLSAEQESELDHFVELEHILRMAKARARQILARER